MEELTRKELILRAAQKLFGSKGFNGTTMKQVADEAGVAFGLVAHYFGNKQKLFLTAGFDMVDRLLERLREETHAAPTGLEAVQSFVEAYLTFTREHRDLFPILIRCSPFSDMPTMVNREKIAEKFREIFDELKRCIRRGIEDGSIREDLPVDETTSLAYSNIMGSVRTVFLTPYDMPGLYDETLKFIVRSIRKDA